MMPLFYNCCANQSCIIQYNTRTCTGTFNKAGDTPLSLACANGHLDTVKYLVKEHHCDPRSKHALYVPSIAPSFLLVIIIAFWCVLIAVNCKRLLLEIQRNDTEDINSHFKSMLHLEL